MKKKLLALVRRWLRRPPPPQAPAWRWMRDPSGVPLVGIRDLSDEERGSLAL